MDSEKMALRPFGGDEARRGDASATVVVEKDKAVEYALEKFLSMEAFPYREKYDSFGIAPLTPAQVAFFLGRSMEARDVWRSMDSAFFGNVLNDSIKAGHRQFTFMNSCGNEVDALFFGIKNSGGGRCVIDYNGESGNYFVVSSLNIEYNLSGMAVFSPGYGNESCIFNMDADTNLMHCAGDNNVYNIFGDCEMVGNGRESLVSKRSAFNIKGDIGDIMHPYLQDCVVRTPHRDIYDMLVRNLSRRTDIRKISHAPSGVRDEAHFKGDSCLVSLNLVEDIGQYFKGGEKYGS